MKLPCLIFFSIIGIGRVSYGTSVPEAIPPIGRIRGSILRSRLGEKIYSFRGVRYAKPPTGERRFQVKSLVLPSAVILLILERYPLFVDICQTYRQPSTVKTKDASSISFYASIYGTPVGINSAIFS